MVTPTLGEQIARNHIFIGIRVTITNQIGNIGNIGNIRKLLKNLLLLDVLDFPDLEGVYVHGQHGQQRQCLDFGNQQPPLPHIDKLVAAENGETLQSTYTFCDFCGLPVW